MPANAGDAGDASSIPGWGRSSEKKMATRSSTLAWEIPGTEEPGGLQSMGSQRVGQEQAGHLMLEPEENMPLSSLHHFCYILGNRAGSEKAAYPGLSHTWTDHSCVPVAPL